MGRYTVLLIAVTVVATSIATSVVADSDFDQHTGRPPIMRPSLRNVHQNGLRLPEFSHFPRKEFVGVPFIILFDDEITEYEPYFDVATPSSRPPPQTPQLQPCLPSTEEKTFTTEVTNGVRIIRGHANQCAQ